MEIKNKIGKINNSVGDLEDNIEEISQLIEQKDRSCATVERERLGIKKPGLHS